MSAYVDSRQASVPGQVTSGDRVESNPAHQRAAPPGWFEPSYVALLRASIAMNTFVLYTIFHIWG
jgi:hypothetical protein